MSSTDEPSSAAQMPAAYETYSRAIMLGKLAEAESLWKDLRAYEKDVAVFSQRLELLYQQKRFPQVVEYADHILNTYYREKWDNVSEQLDEGEMINREANAWYFVIELFKCLARFHLHKEMDSDYKYNIQDYVSNDYHAESVSPVSSLILDFYFRIASADDLASPFPADLQDEIDCDHERFRISIRSWFKIFGDEYPFLVRDLVRFIAHGQRLGRVELLQLVLDFVQRGNLENIHCVDLDFLYSQFHAASVFIDSCPFNDPGDSVEAVLDSTLKQRVNRIEAALRKKDPQLEASPLLARHKVAQIQGEIIRRKTNPGLTSTQAIWSSIADLSSLAARLDDEWVGGIATDSSFKNAFRKLEYLAMTGNEKYIYHPLDSGRQEIRLLRLPNREFATNEPLRLSLVHTSLQDSSLPFYLAVSLCSESLEASEMVDVEVNSQIMSIHRNTEAALRRVHTYATRETFGPLNSYASVFFWVSAVSIDHTNADEKARQEVLVKDIYDRAEETVAILRTDEEELAQEARKSIANLALRSGLVAYSSENPDIRQKPLVCNWSAVNSFYSAPWFTSGLAGLVVVAAQKINCIIGTVAVPWSDVYAASYEIGVGENSPCPSTKRDASIKQILRICGHITVDDYIGLTVTPAGRDANPDENVCEAMHRIGSLLNRMNKLNPQSLASAYVDATKNALLQGSASVVTLANAMVPRKGCRGFNKSGPQIENRLEEENVRAMGVDRDLEVEISLPSWVPNYSQIYDTTLGSPSRLATLTDQTSDTIRKCFSYDASEQHHVLRVSGSLTDFVEHTMQAVTHDILGSDWSAFAHFIHSTWKECHKILRGRDSLEGIQRGFSKALTAGTDLGLGYSICLLLRLCSSKVEDEAFMPREEEFSLINTWMEVIRKSTVNRRLFITMRGVFGIGPLRLQERGPFRILSRGSLSFIVRHYDHNTLVLVGDAYLERSMKARRQAIFWDEGEKQRSQGSVVYEIH